LVDRRRLGVEGILGIRPAPGGVRIDPCMPKDWGRAEVRIRAPEGALIISIEDPENVGKSVVEIAVDGVQAANGFVAFPTDGGEHSVAVRLGKRADRGEPLKRHA
jgi:cyclic beta-1,2-glucan synthetase